MIATQVRLRDLRSVLYAVRSHLLAELAQLDAEEKRQPHYRTSGRLIERLDRLIENLKGAV